MADWKPAGTADVEGEYIDEYPNQAHEGHWWLLGTREDNHAFYLDDQNRNERLVTKTQDGILKEVESKPIPDSLSVFDYIRTRSHDDDSWDTWSRYSWPVYTASSISASSSNLLTKEQAVAYSFREVWDVPRAKTAAVLGKSPNTIDNQLANAKHKIEQARELVDYLEDLHHYAGN